MSDDIMSYQWLTVREIANIVDISKFSTQRILTIQLKMSRVCERWVPCFLMIQKCHSLLFIRLHFFSQATWRLRSVGRTIFSAENGHFATENIQYTAWACLRNGKAKQATPFHKFSHSRLCCRGSSDPSAANDTLERGFTSFGNNYDIWSTV